MKLVDFNGVGRTRFDIFRLGIFFILSVFSVFNVIAQDVPRHSGFVGVLGEDDKTISKRIPLPPGDWIELSNSKRTLNSGTVMRDLLLGQISGDKVTGAFFVGAKISRNQTRWNDEPCKVANFYHKNDFGTRLWRQKCLVTFPTTFLQGTNETSSKALAVISKFKLTHESNAVGVRFTRYDDVDKYINVVYSIFPSAHGLENPVNNVLSSSPWHPAALSNDPAKKDFIDAVNRYAEQYAETMDLAYEDKPVNALNSFLYVSKNQAKKTSHGGIASAIPSSVQAISTVPPAFVASDIDRTSRVAPIANISNVSNGEKLSDSKLQRVTSNPVDLQKKSSPNEVWISFNPSISVQQRQFCRIVENFRVELSIAQQTKNQIKVNEVYRGLSQSLNSLLPDGKFQGWVMRMIYVAQASDGSAEVLMELPCNVYVGSNACDTNPANFYGTAPEGSRIYSEFAKMTVDDFALTSGQFTYTDQSVFNKDRSVASFRTMKTATHCRAKEMANDADFFGLKVDAISTIK